MIEGRSKPSRTASLSASFVRVKTAACKGGQPVGAGGIGIDRGRGAYLEALDVAVIHLHGLAASDS